MVRQRAHLKKQDAEKNNLYIACPYIYILFVLLSQREAETKAKVQEKRCAKRLAVGCVCVCTAIMHHCDRLHGDNGLI